MKENWHHFNFQAYFLKKRNDKVLVMSCHVVFLRYKTWETIKHHIFLFLHGLPMLIHGYDYHIISIVTTNKRQMVTNELTWQICPQVPDYFFSFLSHSTKGPHFHLLLYAQWISTRVRKEMIYLILLLISVFCSFPSLIIKCIHITH